MSFLENGGMLLIGVIVAILAFIGFSLDNTFYGNNTWWDWVASGYYVLGAYFVFEGWTKMRRSAM